jgi:glutathione peroxidase
MSRCFSLMAVMAIACGVFAKEEAKVPAALNFSMKTLDGKAVELNKYRGKVVLIVNVASECGLTPQYEQLQALHEKYHGKGLAVVGVPCNQFGKQEPGSPAEIQEFCKKNYGVSFDLLAKVDVNGAEACDLYKHLKALDTKPKGPGDVSWNFEKFVINRQGEVVARFEPMTSPDAPEVIKVIEAELAKK